MLTYMRRKILVVRVCTYFKSQFFRFHVFDYNTLEKSGHSSFIFYPTVLKFSCLACSSASNNSNVLSCASCQMGTNIFEMATVFLKNWYFFLTWAYHSKIFIARLRVY